MQEGRRYAFHVKTTGTIKHVAKVLGFVGLGVMGGPMAGHLVAAGHSVIVWNRTESKSEPLAAKGAKVAKDLMLKNAFLT